MESTCKPIMNTPKPKPKEEQPPPVPDAKANPGKEKKAKEEPAKMDESAPQNAKEASKDDMDLD